EELLDIVIAWERFIEQDWPGIRDRLYQQLPESLRNHEGNLREFTNMLLETAKTGVIGRQVSDRRRSVSPDSAYLSDTSTSNAAGPEPAGQRHQAAVPDASKQTDDFKDNKGRTQLSYAAESGNELAIEMLLDSDKLDVDSKDNNGRTSLYAAENGASEDDTVRLLLDKGSDIETRDPKRGRTSPQWAARNGNDGIARLLLAAGSAAASKDSLGQSAMELADSSTLFTAGLNALDTSEVPEGTKWPGSFGEGYFLDFDSFNDVDFDPMFYTETNN
ncbi:MAG: ankyrin repeat domain-containing protein, partial [Candidatus Binatia bacterium]